jgi:hypothetical protein
LFEKQSQVGFVFGRAIPFDEQRGSREAIVVQEE